MRLLLAAVVALALAFATSAAPCHRLGEWQRMEDAPTKVTEASCAQVGSILHSMIGFDDSQGGGLHATAEHWALDLDTGVWTQRAPVPYAGSHTQATDNGTHIFIAGAFVGDYPGNVTDLVYAYSIADDLWTAMPPLPRPSASGGFDYVPDLNRLYYFSGLLNYDNSSDIAMYLDLSDTTATWQNVSAPFPDPRNHFLAKRVRPNLIVMPGGQHFNQNPQPIDLATVIGFNPENGTFYTLAPMPAPRSHSDSVVSAGRLIVVGGRDNQAAAQIHTTVLEYSPDEDAWYTLGAMPGQRLSPCVALHTNVSGAWLWMTKGGVDWNMEVAETWVAKVDINCTYAEPTLAPTPAATIATPATASPSSDSTQPPAPSASLNPTEAPAPVTTGRVGATTSSLMPPLNSLAAMRTPYLTFGALLASLVVVLY